MKGNLEKQTEQARGNIREWIRKLGIKKIPSYLPDLITITGVILTAVASFCVATGHFSWAFLVFIASQFMDALDGAFAKEFSLVSKAGAFFDSSVDRLNEFFWYFGLAWYFKETDKVWIVFLIFTTMFFAFMVSYTRARIEGLGGECKIGIFTRLVRVYIMSAIIVLMIYSETLAISFLIVLLIGNLITVIQRFICGLRQFS